MRKANPRGELDSPSRGAESFFRSLLDLQAICRRLDSKHSRASGVSKIGKSAGPILSAFERKIGCEYAERRPEYRMMASRNGTKRPEPSVKYIVLIVERRRKVGVLMETVFDQGGDTQAVSVSALSNAHRGWSGPSVVD